MYLFKKSLSFLRWTHFRFARLPVDHPSLGRSGTYHVVTLCNISDDLLSTYFGGTCILYIKPQLSHHFNSFLHWQAMQKVKQLVVLTLLLGIWTVEKGQTAPSYAKMVSINAKLNSAAKQYQRTFFRIRIGRSAFGWPNC